MRAQAAIQLQLKVQGASQHRGIDLAVVDCIRVPCRSSAFDCVLDKARCPVQRHMLLHPPQAGLINGSSCGLGSTACTCVLQQYPSNAC